MEGYRPQNMGTQAFCVSALNEKMPWSVNAHRILKGQRNADGVIHFFTPRPIVSGIMRISVTSLCIVRETVCLALIRLMCGIVCTTFFANTTSNFVVLSVVVKMLGRLYAISDCIILPHNVINR